MTDINTYTAAEIANLTPQSGDLVLNTDDNAVQLWNGSAWKVFNSDISPVFNEYSVDLDGANDYISVPSSTDFDFGTADFSISMWFNASSIGTSGNEYGGLIYRSLNYRLKFQGNGSSINFVTPGGEKALVRYGSSLLNSWHHLVISTNRTTHEMKSYIDGSPHRTVAISSTESISATGQPLFIGNHYNTYYLGGLVDEVSIFHSTLSDSDVTSIYNSGVPADLSSYSPVGWWRMGDTGSDYGTTTITDAGSGGNDATLVNGPTFSTSVPS